MKTILLYLAVVQNFILMQPIQQAIQSNDFSGFSEICAEKVSLNFESPFNKTGYMRKSKFIHYFKSIFKGYRISEMEWSSLQNQIQLKKVEEIYAVQSLNMKLISVQSGDKLKYKLIFFMVKEKGIQWKIYYLRGIRL